MIDSLVSILCRDLKTVFQGDNKLEGFFVVTKTFSDEIAM